MSGFLARLLSSRDRGIDELVVFGFLALVVLVTMTIYDVVVLAHAFAPVSFAGSASSIMGATAAAVGGRDKLSPPAPRVEESGGA